MGGITDKERGLDAGSRGVASDGGTAVSPLTESHFWRSPQKVHRVVFPGTFYDAAFDFRSTEAGGRSGVVTGLGAASSHRGTYQITHSTADALTMKVTIGTGDNPTADMNAILVIDRRGASVSGTLKGKAAAPAEPVPVKGSGTAKNPFQASFPDQDLVWHVSVP